MWSDWQQLLVYLKQSFSIKGDLLSILFLIGIQESGTGFREYTQEEKTALIKLAKYTLLSRAGYFTKVALKNRDPLFIQNDDSVLPLDTEKMNTILKKEVITYFNQFH